MAELMSGAVKYKTKLIQFFDRTTPIILQNDNGPCPLLAICNVLLLKNILSLRPGIEEVSQEDLLSLVGRRLISNLINKDAGYIENQQQNISDAFVLLPQLATGIDVNIKFKEVTDFEFTRECAIFDLLDIPLYHGWLVDPQDSDTYNAIGSKSYNTIMGDLVGLETAMLKAKKGDLQEEAQLLAALKLSDAEIITSSKDNVGDSIAEQNISVSASGSSKLEKSEPVVPTQTSKGNIGDGIQKSWQHQHISNDVDEFGKNNSDLITLDVISEKDDYLSSKNERKIPNRQLSCEESGEFNIKNVGGKTSGLLDFQQSIVSDSCEPDPLCRVTSSTDDSGRAKGVQDESLSKRNIQQEEVKESAQEASKIASSTVYFKLGPAGGGRGKTDLSETVTPGFDGTESGATSHEDQEPVYEGEVVFAEEVDKRSGNASDVGCKNGLSPEQGELVKGFLEANASQLTIFGLISLQEKLNDCELCVFFRNNHFNTMFKYEGQLYLLVTDQGYINQPDLVWEKLNEVNGNTEFVTGTFTEFNDISNYDSDLQLAMALQELEYEQPQHDMQQLNFGGGSGPFRGPQEKLKYD